MSGPLERTSRGGRGGTAAVLALALVAAACIPVLFAGAASADPVAPPPLVKYDFNEGTGTTAGDSSGNGFNGTLTGGAAWTASGRNYGGVTLDGNSGYVNLPNGALKNTHAVTMSVNVNLAASKHQWYGTLGYSTSKYIGIEQNGSTLTGYFTNSNQQTVAAANVAPAVGTWANVTLVVDTATSHTMKLYVNGVLDATTNGITGDVGGLYDATQTFGGYIGKSVWNGDPYLNARVDDFEVYGSVLTDAQIAALAANAPVSPATTAPVAVSTAPGTAPSLPSSVTVPFTDGESQALPVNWANIDPSQYANSGSFSVQGTTSTTPSLPATATVDVLPLPTLTLGSKGQDTVTLNWAAEDGAATYTLSRSTTSGSGYTQVYSGGDTTFTDTGLSLNTSYYYVLSYTTIAGGTSSISPELAVKTDTKLVGPPTVTQSSYLMTNRIDLSWNAVDLADSYNIYRATSPDGSYTLVTNTASASYKDNDVSQGSTYYYEVSCVNGAGEGPLSPALAAKTAIDTVPPTTVTSTGQTDSSISLTWVPVDGASSYSLYRSTTSGAGYSQVYSGTGTNYVDKNLVTGTTYYYVVTYTDSLGTSANSAELTESTAAVTVPAPSAIKVVKAYTNAVNLGWNSVVGANSFNLYRADNEDGPYTLVNNTSANSYTNVGLAAGTTYYYEITSVNAAGEGAPSTPFKVTTDTGTNTILTNKTTWYDDDGNPIQAGSGDIIQVGSTYYWYGTGSGPFDMNVYSSPDLVHWKFENRILTAGSLGMDGQPAADLALSNGNHFERPKVIYNASTKEFVLLVHYDSSDYTTAEVGTAESSTPTGNFTWDHAFRPAGLDSRDMTAFVDTDGTGYVISATLTNAKVTLFQLTPDYLSVAKQMYNIYGGDNSSSIYSGREAPAMVKSDGVYYLVTSAAAGWYPSDAMYSTATADSLADTTAASWQGSTNVDAAAGWDGGGVGDYLGNRNDFGGQSVYIVTVTGTHGTSYILMNDTLNPKAGGVSGPLWLPLKLDDGVATVDYSSQINVNAKAGEVTNVYSGSLLSQGKPATASSFSNTDSDGNVNPNGWTAGYANDGDYNTEWKATSDIYPSWWQVDLGQEYSVNDVQLNWWMIGGSEATEDFQIQVSDDNQNWSVAYDMSSGDTQYGFNDAQFPAVQARYVRVTILGSHTQNNNGGWYIPQLYEAKVYGDPAPASVTATADPNGNYNVQIPSNIENYPATGSFTTNLGNVSVAWPTADLLGNLGAGSLTAGNDKTSSATVSAINAASPSDSKVVDNYDLTLVAGATALQSLSTPAEVTVQLSSADITALSAEGTPGLFYYDTATKTLANTNAVFDLGAGTVTYNATGLGTYVLESTGIPQAPFTVKTKPVIQGTAQIGSKLTVSAGTYSIGGVSTSYQWLRNGQPISGATGSSYTVTVADYKARLSATVTATKTGYANVATTTAQTAAVAAGTFTVKTNPVINGAAKVGGTLTVTSGAYSVSGVTATYQWLRSGKAISGATSASYVVTSADLGKALSVKVTASETGYASVVTTTASTATVVGGALTVTTKPSITGTAQVGQTLTEKAGSYSVSGAKESYQWLRNGQPIAGATAVKYAVTTADYTAKLSVQVTATKTNYTQVTSTSATTAKVEAGTFKVTTKPSITGTATVGKTLKVKAGTYSVSGITESYQWLRNGSIIKGATGNSYKLTSAGQKAKLSVQVTAAKTGYSSVTTTTATTAKVS